MSFDDAFDITARDFAKRREQAQDAADAARALAYGRIPALAALEHELSVLGVGIGRLVLEGDRKGIDAAKKTMSRLQKKRQTLLGQHNLADTDFLPRYACADCEDTGRVASGSAFVRCGCFTRQLIQENYAQSGMAAAIKSETFDNFDIRLFDEKRCPDAKISPRANMEKIFGIAQDFVSNFGSGQNILFYGPPGRGKTFMCHCIVNDLMDGGHRVFYISAPRLFEAFEDKRFGHDAQKQRGADVQNMAYAADLLVIDDLGSEFATVVTLGALLDLINHRLISRLGTVISTNLDPFAQMRDIYSERITSRLIGEYSMHRFFGKDQRIENMTTRTEKL